MDDISQVVEQARDSVAAFFTSVEDDLIRNDAVQDDVQGRRGKVIDLLGQMVAQLDDSVPQKMNDTIAKLMPVQAYLSALKDQEASTRKRVETKLKNKGIDTANNAAEVVAEFLRKRPDQRLLDLPETHLDDVTQELDREISESSSPIMETEMRTDPTDLR